MDTHRNRPAAYLLVLFAGFGFSIAAAGFQAAQWHPAGNMAGRGIVAAAMFMILFRTVPRRLTGRQWIGVVVGALQSALFITSLNFTSGALAMTLLYTCLMWTPLFAALTGEKVPRRDWVVCGVIFSAIVFAFLDAPTAGQMTGNIMALAAGAGWGIAMVLLKNESHEARVHMSITTSLILAVGGFGFSYALGLQPTVPGRAWVIVVLGVAYAVSFMALLKAFNSLRSSEVTVGISALDSTLGVVWVIIFSRERPGLFAIIGGGIILATVIVHGILSVREKAPPTVDIEQPPP